MNVTQALETISVRCVNIAQPCAKLAHSTDRPMLRVATETLGITSFLLIAISVGLIGALAFLVARKGNR